MLCCAVKHKNSFNSCQGFILKNRVCPSFLTQFIHLENTPNQRFGVF
ncbi:hypothetical protein [Moraxella lacunata]